MFKHIFRIRLISYAWPDSLQWVEGPKALLASQPPSRGGSQPLCMAHCESIFYIKREYSFIYYLQKIYFSQSFRCQSEKDIRTRSSISQGFKMSEIMEIFSSVSNSAKTESNVDLLSERLNFQIENIQFHIEIQREDQPIIYCVAGVISRAILNRTKCEKCRETPQCRKLGSWNYKF